VTVLYVNHTSQVSGAELSLLSVMDAVRSSADVLLAAPDGDLLRRAEQLGIPTVAIQAPRVSFGSRPTEVAAGIAELVRAGRRIHALVREANAQLVHAGSARAGLMTAFFGSARLARVVDVRDVLPLGARGRATRWTLRLGSDAIVFNSDYTRGRFGKTAPACAAVVHPLIDIGPFLRVPARNGESEARPMLGVVGQITPWKGQDDAIRVLAQLRATHPEARLRIIGAVVFSGPKVSYDNESFAQRLRELAHALGVADAVEFVGAVEDMPAALASLDILLVPSWEEPFGRVVVEAMAAGVPVVATRHGGPAEQIEDGVTGLLAEPRRPELWVEPVSRLLRDIDLRRSIVGRARSSVTAGHDPAECVARLLGLYEALMGRPGWTARRAQRPIAGASR
jgi:glycosyltransferase involved in cell wall biosynthesis